MAGNNTISEILGDKEIADILGNILPKEADNLLRSTVDGIAGEIKKRASANARGKSFQTISKALKNKRKKSPPGKPVSQVFVEHGKSAKHDAWYWHFFEFGTANRVIKRGKFAGRAVGKIREQPFIRPAFQSVIGKLDQVIREQFQKKLTKRIAAVQKKMAQS